MKLTDLFEARLKKVQHLRWDEARAKAFARVAAGKIEQGDSIELDGRQYVVRGHLHDISWFDDQTDLHQAVGASYLDGKVYEVVIATSGQDDHKFVIDPVLKKKATLMSDMELKEWSKRAISRQLLYILKHEPGGGSIAWRVARYIKSAKELGWSDPEVEAAIRKSTGIVEATST